MTDSDSSAAVARDAGLAVVARIVAMACTTITTFVVAGMLSKAEYGAYAIVFGIQVVLVMALDLGLTSSLARYVAQGRATTRLVVATGALRLVIIGVAAAAVFVAPATPWLSESRSLVVVLLPALAALVVAQSLVSMFFGLLPSLRRIRLLMLVTIAQPAAELALVLVARARGGDVEEVVLATVAAGFCVSAIAWVLLLAPGRAAAPSVPVADPSEHATLRMVAEYGRHIFAVSLLLAVFGQVDQFVIGAFHPLAAVAPYALALKVQAMLSAAPIVVAGIVAPRIAGAGTGALELYRRWILFLTVVTTGAVLTIIVLARELFGTFDAAYRGDWLMVPAMSVFLLLGAIAPLPAITLNQTGHAGERLPIAIRSVLVNVVLDLVLVPPLGAWGAVIATTIAFAYYFLRHHVLLERELARSVASDADAPARRLFFLQGMAAALVVAAVAAGIRAAMLATSPGIPDLAILVAAGSVAAMLHVAWSLRIIRRPLA